MTFNHDSAMQVHGKQLSHIVIRWIPAGNPAEAHHLYDALEIGEDTCRTRAAAHVKLIKEHGGSVTRYRAYFGDCTTVDLEK